MLVEKNITKSSFDCVFLTGRGRSGTTWLGQIMNTYQNCAYKYEPFLPLKNTVYRQWLQKIHIGNTEELREEFWKFCGSCYFDVDMPPFIPKDFRWQNPYVLKLLYGIGKQVKVLKFLYESYGRTKLDSQASILIKDVNFPNHLLPYFCEILSPKLIAMVRNPFANYASGKKGRELGLLGKKDLSNQVDSICKSIELSGQEALSYYTPLLASMSEAQLSAITWRLEVEPLVFFAQSYKAGLVLVYEDLCMDTLTKVAEVFEFVGWPLEKNTLDFIELTTSGERQVLDKSKAYYSVYRDPKQSLEKWRSQLSEREKEDINEIFSESPVRTLWGEF